MEAMFLLLNSSVIKHKRLNNRNSCYKTIANQTDITLRKQQYYMYCIHSGPVETGLQLDFIQLRLPSHIREKEDIGLQCQNIRLHQLLIWSPFV